MKKVFCGKNTSLLLITVLLLNILLGSLVFAADSDQAGFTDTISHWAKADIDALVKAGIVKGKDETHFAPEDDITKAEFLALCLRAADIKETEFDDAFSDIKADDWYAKTVQAAKDAGLIDDGLVLDGNFNPNQPITREEMTSIIVNAHDYVAGSKTISTDDLSKFEDKGEISSWALSYTAAALELKFIYGTTDTTFSPKQKATRAQAAVIAKRLLDKISTPVDIEDPSDFDGSYSMLTSVDVKKTSYRWSGYLGMQITVRDQPLKITHIGRLCFKENVIPHNLVILNAASGQVVASAEVDMANKQAGKFVYAKLDSPVTLEAKTTYYVLSSEVEKKDVWADKDTLITSDVVSIDMPVYGPLKDGVFTIKPDGDVANTGFIPIDLKYAPITSETPPNNGIVKVNIVELAEVPGQTYAYPASLETSSGIVEKFDIHMWIPAEVKTVKGIIFISEHGDGSVLARRNIAFRELAAKMNWAICYFDSQALKDFVNKDTSGNLILKAVDDFAVKSSHPELVNVPFATFAHSNGNGFSGKFAAWIPERFFGVIAYKCANAGQFQFEELKNVPLMVVTGELDTGWGYNGQKEGVVAMRQLYGAASHYIMDPGAGHGANEGKSNSIVFAFLEDMFNALVPADFDPAKGMIKLNTINEKTGWLGDPDTHVIASYADYSGDKTKASWFINEAYAKKWKEFVETGVVAGIKLQ